MENAIHSTVAAGAALSVAAALLAAPIASPPGWAATPDLRLTASVAGIVDGLEAAQLQLGGHLTDGQESFGGGLVGFEVGLQQFIFGSDSALNGVINRGFNVLNMGIDAINQATQGVLGFHSGVDALTMPSAPADFAGLTTIPGVSELTSAYLVGLNPALVLNSGAIGGLEAMVAQGTQAVANVIGLPTSDMMWGLNNFLITLNDRVVDGVQGANGGLVNAEVGLEQLIFGTDSALNGVINRGFNTINMGLDTIEQTLLGMLGMHGGVTNGVSSITESLLTGSADQVFNGGDIGGLTGMFDQALMVLVDFGGLFAG